MTPDAVVADPATSTHAPAVTVVIDGTVPVEPVPDVVGAASFGVVWSTPRYALTIHAHLPDATGTVYDAGSDDAIR